MAAAFSIEPSPAAPSSIALAAFPVPPAKKSGVSSIVGRYMSRDFEQIFPLAQSFLFTNLHIAVITVNEVLVQHTLSTPGIEVNAMDIRNFTPLHHCALVTDITAREAIKAMLIAHKAVVELRNIFGDTYEDVCTRIKLPSESLEGLTGVFERNAAGELLPVSRAAYFRKNKGIIYADKVHSTIDYEIQAWVNPIFSPILPPVDYQLCAPKFSEKIMRDYEARQKDPSSKPRLVLTSVDRDASGKPIANMGLSITPASLIPQGTYLDTYNGLKEREQTVSMYRAGQVDSRRYGNEMSLVNDGFPNMMYWNSGRTILFFAVEDIKPSDWICSDYGLGHQVKLEIPYTELRPEQLRRFVKNELLKYMPDYDLKKFIAREPENVEEELLILRINAGLTYILDTPVVLFNMILDKTLTVRHAQKLFSEALDPKGSHLNLNCRPIIPEHDPKYLLPKLCSIADATIKVSKKLDVIAPDLAKTYMHYVTSLPGRYGIITCLFISLNAYSFFRNHFMRIEALPAELRAAEWPKLNHLWEEHLKAELNPIGERYLKALSATLAVEGR